MQKTKRLAALFLAVLFVLTLLPMSVFAQEIPGVTTKVEYENTDPNKYYIEIDRVNQIITVYEGAPELGVIVHQGLCTTGSKETPTGSGVYELGNLKERFGYFVAFGQFAQYWTQIIRGIYIHSIMYNTQNTDSMSKTAFNELGTNVSHGCVRVLPHIAQFIYYNCPPGTLCNVNKSKPKNPELVAKLKAEQGAFEDYVQPVDSKLWAREVPAIVRYNNTPLRTGFNALLDTTVGILSQGQQVILSQIASDWCKVETLDGTLGYVRTRYLLFEPDGPSNDISYVSQGKTYVYAEMSTNSERLATVPKDAEVEITGSTGNYYWYGTYNGQPGFFRKRYIVQQDDFLFPTMAFQLGLDSTTGISYALVPTTSKANSRLRAEPSYTGALVGLVAPGAHILVMGLAEDAAWYYVKAGSYYGYMHYTCFDRDALAAIEQPLIAAAYEERRLNKEAEAALTPEEIAARDEAARLAAEAEALRVEAEQQAAAAALEANLRANCTTEIKAGHTASVRTQPSAQPSSFIMGSLPAGTEIFIKCQKGKNWFLCESDTFTGYVHRVCLTSESISAAIDAWSEYGWPLGTERGVLPLD